MSGPPVSAPLLAFRDAVLGYASARVLQGVGLELFGGEVVGLVGPNGAGKTTLLRALTGAADLLGGTLEITGVPAHALSARDRALRVGVVPQSVTAAFSFSAREFVEMGRHAHLRRLAQLGAEDRDVVERSMRLTDTLRLAEVPVDTLSGGDLQRLALAQALAQEPRLLLLDEPVSHLDLNHRLQILDLVRDLADQGLGVLAVFHDLDLAARYSDRIALVAAGRVRPAARPADVITAETLRDVFEVRAVVGTDPVTGSVSVTPVLREQAARGPARGRVMLVAGSGSGAGLMRRLTLSGYEVMTAALNVGDVDEAVAVALGLERVTLPPYGAIDDAACSRVTELASSADAIVVCAVPFGSANVDNLRIAAAARRPLVLVGGIDGRDYTGGQAKRIWDEAAAVEGTRRVPDDTSAEEALRELLGS